MHVCRIVKRRLMNTGLPKSIKVGHGGTLDPLASGLLVILIGKATRLCDVIMAGEKEYSATIDLEHFSASCDLETRPEPAEVKKVPSYGQIEEVLKQFTGEIQQCPPVYSAMWIDGKRAYDLARKGRDVEMAARPVCIRSISIEAFAWPTLTIHIVCGKGTYIRSLARDIGVALGTGGVLTQLRRTRIGSMRIEDSVHLDAMADPLPVASLRPIPLEFAHLLVPGDSTSGSTQRSRQVDGRSGPVDSIGEDPDDGVVAGDFDSGEQE